MKKQIISKLKGLTLITLFFICPNCVYSQLSDWTNHTYIGAIYSILEDGDHLWLATETGVVKFNKKTEEKVIYNRSNAGLPENKVLKLAKDPDGSIWLATYRSGIGKLEGNQCTVYNSSNSGLLHDQMCNAIIIDKENNKWIGSAGQLTKFDGKKWESWTTPNGSMYNSWYIHSLIFDKNNVLWIGGLMEYKFLAKFDGKEIRLIEDIAGEVFKIDFDKDGIMWLATNGGLVKYDGKTFISYTTKNSNLPDNNIYDLVIDNKNNIWMACSRYLICYDGKDFTKYETPLINDDNNFIHSLAISDNQTIWLGTRRNGLIKYSDGNFKAVNMGSSPLVTNTIGFSGQVDSEGNFWFNTEHNLMKVDKDNVWHSYFEKIDYSYIGEWRTGGFGVDPSGNVWTALGRSDTIVAKMKDGKVTAGFTRKNTPVFRQFIQADCQFSFDEKGNVWLSSRTGFYKYDGEKWTWFIPGNSPFTSNTVFEIVFDKEGNIWGGTGNEFQKGCLFKYDGTNWVIFTPENSGLPTSIIAALAFDSKNNLWIHCRDNGNFIGVELGAGLTKFDGKTWTTYHTRNSGIPSNSILDITIDKNDNIWLATVDAGITRFDGKNWTSYNTANSGIANNDVSKITFDYERDLIWLNHLDSKGISTARLNWHTSIENNLLNNKDEGFIICNDPTTASLHLQFNDNLNPEKLELFNISGRLIASRILNTTNNRDFSIPLSELNIMQNGLYLIKLSTPVHVYTKKLMVEQ